MGFFRVGIGRRGMSLGLGPVTFYGGGRKRRRTQRAPGCALCGSRTPNKICASCLKTIDKETRNVVEPLSRYVRIAHDDDRPLFDRLEAYDAAQGTLTPLVRYSVKGARIIIEELPVSRYNMQLRQERQALVRSQPVNRPFQQLNKNALRFIAVGQNKQNTVQKRIAALQTAKGLASQMQDAANTENERYTSRRLIDLVRTELGTLGAAAALSGIENNTDASPQTSLIHPWWASSGIIIMASFLVPPYALIVVWARRRMRLWVRILYSVVMVLFSIGWVSAIVGA